MEELQREHPQARPSAQEALPPSAESLVLDAAENGARREKAGSEVLAEAEAETEKRLEPLPLSEEERALTKEELRAALRTLAEDIRQAAAVADEHEARVLWAAKQLGQLEKYAALERQTRTPEGLLTADLDEVAEQGHTEVLRERIVRTALRGVKSADELRGFEEQFPPDKWTHKEFFEFTNRYRLLSSPEDEVRLFEASQETAFAQVPRAREFYALALIKMNRTEDAIRVCRQLVDDGFDNGLVQGIIGDAHARRARDETRSSTGSPEDAEKVRKSLKEAAQAYRAGFEESANSFAAFGWNESTNELVKNARVEKSRLEEVGQGRPLRPDEQERLRELTKEIAEGEVLIENQLELIGVSLELQGGDESHDYWNHTGALQLAIEKGKTVDEIRPLLARAFEFADAGFKISNIIERFEQIRDRLKETQGLRLAPETAEKNEERLKSVEFALQELGSGLERYNASQPPSALDRSYRDILSEGSKETRRTYLDGTISFRALTGSLTPTYIPGGLGRAGARVPDIVINRQDIQTFEQTIEHLGLADEQDPRVIKNKIEDYVRGRLGVDSLQDLTSPEHKYFDDLSDGTIELSGITPEMRRGTASITNLAASLLIGVGDCRETMYAAGALFAVQEKMRVRRLIKKGLLSLDRNDQASFRGIVDEEIGEAMRYELRGQHAAVYAQGIAMNGKYDAQMGASGERAKSRMYGLDDLRSGRPLTTYELENSCIQVTYTDGTKALLKPQDPQTGRWRPLEHQNGVPTIPRGDMVESVAVLNLVEEHTLSHLHDTRTGTVELADGFYDGQRHGGPYAFGEGTYDLDDQTQNDGLVRAGTRVLENPDGTLVEAPVFLESKPYSTTDYKRSLGEADMPDQFRLMGRTFHADIRQETARATAGTSVFPRIMDRIYQWRVGSRSEQQ